MKIKNLFAAAILAAGTLSWTSVSHSEEKAASFIAKELLVKFKPSENAKSNQEIRKIGAKLLEKLSTIDVSRLSLPAGLTVARAVKQMSALNIVEYAEPNYIERATAVPNDPEFGDQWGMQTIRALKGWGIHTGRSSTVIAILDTGVDLKHPELKNRLVKGYDYADNDDSPDDVGGHGTHCAGIAAGAANNQLGIAGVCPNCSIMPVRVLGTDGGPSSDVAKGIIFAVDHGAHVISLSLGSYFPSSTLADAVDYATKKNVLVIAAAGKDNTDSAHYPAYLTQCIAVGSTTSADTRSSFSNYGDWVDVAAPGDMILSTVPKSDFSYKSGTSMATPFASGLAGLMRSCPGATAERIRNAILSSGKPVGNWVAHGRIDVYAALEKLGCKQESGTGTGQGQSAGQGQGTGQGQSAGPGNQGGAKSGAGALTFSPSSHQLGQGTTLKAPANALVKSDDARLSLQSKGAGLNNTLEVIVETQVTTSAAIEAMTVDLEASSDNPGVIQASLYNWSAGSWDGIGKFRPENVDTTASMKKSGAGAYISKSGDVRLKLYRTEKRWNGFELYIDLIRITLTKAKS